MDEPKRSVHKVPGGKLLKVHLWPDQAEERISKVKIFGDFFVHPEESIEDLEKHLQDTRLDTDAIVDRVSEFLESAEVEIFGITPEAIAHAIMLAIEAG